VQFRNAPEEAAVQEVPGPAGQRQPVTQSEPPVAEWAVDPGELAAAVASAESELERFASVAAAIILTRRRGAGPSRRLALQFGGRTGFGSFTEAFP
jgi:hypothetical protein